MKKHLTNKGETGIGTLIVFIAMIMVAAIAASVLLGTAGSLQQKSLSTGKQTEQEVSSGIQIVSLTGTDGTDSDLEDYELLVKLAAGSDPVSLNSTLITLDTKTTTQNIRYSGEYGTGSANSVSYSAEYLKNGSDHLGDYLNNGDIVKIRFNSTSPIGQSQSVKLRIVPKHGVIVPMDFRTPDVVSTQRVMLYP